MPGRALLDLLLARISDAAGGVKLFEFRHPQGRVLPAADAGSHIELHLPKGFVRQYSLLDASDAPEAYHVAVKRDAAGRGASRWLHDAAREGFRFLVGAPENGFPLTEEAPCSVLIAGGIGIAPIRCMIARLDALGRDWRLHYAARSRAEAAFADELTEHGERARIYVEDAVLDIEATVAAASPDAHLYCCGPRAMLQAFERATVAHDPARIHTEYFFPRHEPTLGGFTLELARSRREVAVPRGQTILDALLEAGVNVPHACLEGLCGRCEVSVLAGTPDHRDEYLSPARRAAGRTIVTCRSGVIGDRLTLDL
ncbi:MAG: oxidoreductase [Alphaproteobacteria bacterium]|nr:oxidoreductase [Alphaproteobacteria bacterium]